MTRSRRTTGSVLAFVALAVGVLVSPVGAGASATLPKDSFYVYSGSTPLADMRPGVVLKTRTLMYHVLDVSVPLKVVQLLYRSTNEVGRATVNATSIVEPSIHSTPVRVVAYQSAYDSLNPADEPSAVIAGGLSFGGLLTTAELGLFGSMLLQGYTVVIADTEGQSADFAAGPEYGMNTLNSLRAAYASPATGIPQSAKTVLIGYSGGAIGTEWAAELAPAYAPDVNRRLVGASMGGVLVDPDHNLRYAGGSLLWGGAVPMGLIGISRAFGLDFTPYLNAYGRSIVAKLRNASLLNAFGEYPGLTWPDITLPEDHSPASIPSYVDAANQLIMSSHGTPTIPLFVEQGTGGVLEGTLPGGPGIGAGDGIMVAGDVRSMVRAYCARGVKVQYHQHALDHGGAAAFWLISTASWVNARFAGVPAPQNCNSVAAGNSLAPLR